MMTDGWGAPGTALAWMVVPIVAPLAGGLLALCPGRRAAPRAAAATAIVVVAGVAGIAAEVARGGTLRYTVGGWEAPLGIALVADGLTVLMLAMSAVVGIGVSAYAAAYFRRAPRRAAAFWPQWLILWAGLHALFLSGDLFNLYVTLELVTFATVPLVTLGEGGAALMGAMRYLLIALFGSLLYLLGVALLYAGAATLDLAQAGAALADGPVGWAALALISVGLLLKTAIVPLHAWLPPAHANAPAPASALLSALVVKASFYVLLRTWFEVFPVLRPLAAAQVLGGLGALAVIWGSLQALRQQRLKRLIAYSTVAQLGYLLLLFPLATPGSPWAVQAWSGGVYHAVSHACAKAGMFLAAGALVQAAGTDRIDGLAGRGSQLALLLCAIGLAAINSLGLPPSGGFVAKWLLLDAAFASGQWWWALVLGGGTLLSAAYLYPLVRCAFASAPADAAALPVGRALWAAPLALSLATLGLGLAPAAPLALLRAAAPAVLSGSGVP